MVFVFGVLCMCCVVRYCVVVLVVLFCGVVCMCCCRYGCLLCGCDMLLLWYSLCVDCVFCMLVCFLIVFVVCYVF